MTLGVCLALWEGVCRGWEHGALWDSVCEVFYWLCILCMASLPERKLASHFLKFECMLVLRVFWMSKRRGTVSKAFQRSGLSRSEPDRKKQQRSYVYMSKRLVSLGIVKDSLEGPPCNPRTFWNYRIEGFKGALNWSTMMLREMPNFSERPMWDFPFWSQSQTMDSLYIPNRAIFQHDHIAIFWTR